MKKQTIFFCLAFLLAANLSAQLAEVDTVELHWELASDLAARIPLKAFNGYIWQRNNAYSWSRSADGETWELVIFPPDFERVTWVYGGKGHWIIQVVGTGAGFHYSDDDGQHWRQTAEGIDGYDFLFTDDRIYFYGDQLAWSEDKGMTWQVETDPPVRIPSLSLMELENALIFKAPYSDHFYRSLDQGQSWEPFEVTAENPDRLGIYQNQLWLTEESGKVWTSDDLGDNWVQTSDSLPDSGFGWHLFRDRFNGSFIGEGIIVMTDSYFTISNNFPAGIAHILFGKQAGKDWNLIADIPTTELKSHFFHQDYFYIHDSWNLWRVKRTEMEQILCEGMVVSIADRYGSEKNFNLFPNPVEDRLYLSYELPQSGEINIQVFDPVGKEYPALRITKKQGVGKQLLSWSTTGLAPGNYFLYFESKNRNFLKRFIKTP